MYVLRNLGIMKLRKQEKLKNERFVKVDRHHKSKKKTFDFRFFKNFVTQNSNTAFKSCVHYIFASFFFLSLTESAYETIFFISLQKLFFFSRENQILDIQISGRHQMPKNKTNTIY